jgi:hypothetical protein
VAGGDEVKDARSSAATLRLHRNLAAYLMNASARLASFQLLVCFAEGIGLRDVLARRPMRGRPQIIEHRQPKGGISLLSEKASSMYVVRAQPPGY